LIEPRPRLLELASPSLYPLLRALQLFQRSAIPFFGQHQLPLSRELCLDQYAFGFDRLAQDCFDLSSLLGHAVILPFPLQTQCLWHTELS
jgi:hypothetical protein